MAVELRPLTAVLVLLAVLSAGAAGSIAVADPGTVESEAATKSVPLDDTERTLWLYTTPTRSLEEPTLAINVVVYADPDAVQQLLLREGDGNWNETDADEQDVVPDENPDAAGAVEGTSIEWNVADGARRYVYLSGRNRGTWLTETYQIHDGDYLGSRHHVRAYTSPDRDTNWTAMQAHHEHWDWFSGRHVVTSTGASQTYVEQEFVDEPGTPEISRIPVGHGNQVDFDKWLTIVDFRDRDAATVPVPSSLPAPESVTGPLLLLLVLGAVGTRRTDVTAALQREFRGADGRTLLLATAIVALFMTVRLTGIAIERSLVLPPKPVATVLYPALFAGIPILAYQLARPLDGPRAFTGASLGFLTALLVDYSYLGVTHLPLDLLVHRVAMAVALGVIAVGSAGSTREDADRLRHLRFGVLLWLVATIAPLLRHTPLPV